MVSSLASATLTAPVLALRARRRACGVATACGPSMVSRDATVWATRVWIGCISADQDVIAARLAGVPAVQTGRALAVLRALLAVS